MESQAPAYYWVRLKPFNEKRGHKLQRLHFLGRLWTGGDGFTPGCIPEWVKVNTKQAEVLKSLRQDGSTIGHEPKAFDICSEEQKVAIDAREEEYRRSLLGYGRPTITEMPDVAAASIDLGSKAAKRRLTMDDLSDTAPVSSGASLLSSDDDGGVSSIPGAVNAPPIKAPSTDLAVSDLAGRSAAAEGFESAGGFDLNDGQDVNDVAPQPGKLPGEMPIPAAPVPDISRRQSRRGR